MGLLIRALERKTVDFTEKLLAGAQTAAGVTVTESTALKASGIWACVRVIAEDVATLPLLLYERLDRGKRRVPEHPVYGLLHDQPNPEMTALQFRETLTAHVLTWGNGYGYIVRDDRGQARELWPLLPDRTTPRRDSRTKALYYEIRDTPELKKPPTWIAPPEDILHIMGLGFDGLVGYSPIRMHAQAIGLAGAAEEFGARFFGQGLHLGGFIKHPATMSEPAHQRLTTEINEQRVGLAHSHTYIILEEGASYEKIGIPPEEAQFIELRQFQIEDIARIYRMPPHKIQHLLRSTFANIEHQAIEYVVDTLRPWLVRWEQAILMKLLSPVDRQRYFAEHLVEGLLRGDTQTRYTAYNIGINGGWLSRNEVREKENLDPVDGLDEYLEPLNMRPVGSGDPSPVGKE